MWEMGLEPDWPHLSCLSIQTTTHAYLDKGKALLFSKLARATAVRILSVVKNLPPMQETQV